MPTPAIEALDPLTLPLWGSRLVEASAGTGKTWSIAALVLRLVLGHGGEHGYRRPLLPAEILVMTFTRAATRELSDRIRTRLLHAARCFRGAAAPAPDDAFLARLLQGHPAGPVRDGAAQRLAAAAEAMDEAAVLTIDAWCQRMLREHAFESGSLFDEALDANEAAMQLQAAQDYWRQQLVPLPAAALDVALTVWRDVDALAYDAWQLAPLGRPPGAGQGSLQALIEGEQAAGAAALAALKSGWAERARAMHAWLRAQLADPASAIDRRKLTAGHCARWLAQLEAWATDPEAVALDLKTGASRLTPEGIRESLRPGATIAVPPPFEAFAELMQALARPTPLAEALRLHAAARIAERLAELKRSAGSYGYTDMLERLDAALDPARNGAHAQRLREHIVAQYPVALVDEFQDTSPLQARILDRLYRIESNDPATALLLIGDPKQSIYAFRGADIHSYLQARRATAGRHYALATNYRATTALVAALNHVFGQAEARAGGGAFLFRRAAVPGNEDEGGDGNPLPFVAVRAHGRAEAFGDAQGAGAALTFELDAELRDKGASLGLYAARCAEHIARLLCDARAGFEHPQQGWRRLRPADIAVLVRTGVEAAAVRRELRRRRVASVYLSDRDSVWASAEARDLLRWLQAVATPRDVRLARAALATRTVGLAIEELAQLAVDDAALDARIAQLGQLHAVWQGQGVLAMLRQTLHRFGLPARWLSAEAAPQEGGERRLTNVLHMAELLQEASARHPGEQALIRWLAERVTRPALGGDEQIVRLESDADLVQVVTVHKSKGLEYALVFLPFASAFRPVDARGTAYVERIDEAGVRSIHLQPGAADLAAADRERLRQDLRLLYVALTRARHRVWVGLAALRIGKSAVCVWHRSAVGALLGGSAPLTAEALPGRVAAAVAACPTIALTRATDPDAITCTRVPVRDEPPPLRESAAYAADFDRRWAIGSYTALVRGSDAAPTATPVPALQRASNAAVRDDEAPAEAGLDVVPQADGAEPAASMPTQPWHGFPRGALAGTFLHDQLEWLAGEGYALAARPELQQQLLRRCERQGLSPRAAAVRDWLSAAVTTPLPPLGVALRDLVAPLPEMEFWLPNAGLAASAVDALCRAHLLPGVERPPLPERELHGMLMGFADLVFEHGGRYWVLDYKSNHLGPRDADYSAPALAAAVAAHRYDVQAALYLLALHRLLRSRLGVQYDPARQLGGAIFYFLRGLHSESRGCHHVGAVPALLAGLDALIDGGAGAER